MFIYLKVRKRESVRMRERINPLSDIPPPNDCNSLCYSRLKLGASSRSPTKVAGAQTPEPSSSFTAFSQASSRELDWE